MGSRHAAADRATRTEFYRGRGFRYDDCGRRRSCLDGEHKSTLDDRNLAEEHVRPVGEPVFNQEKLRDISGAATARSLRLPDVPWTREKGFATVAKFVCGMSTRRRKKGEPPGAFTTGSAVSPSATMGKFSQQAVAGDGKIVVASKANCACGTHRPAAKSANLLPDTRTSLRGHSGAGLGLA